MIEKGLKINDSNPDARQKSRESTVDVCSWRQVTNAFTVDVEDYFQVQAFADRIDCRTWDSYESRVVDNTQRLLRLLEEFQVRGTFFVLGWTAERYPQLVRDIQQAGHEIGCHSYWHRLVYQMTPEEFRADLRQATETISQITGEPVTAFRAPSFSITDKSLWALDILLEEGYLCDSSVFPIRHDTYGIPGSERFPHIMERAAGQIVEVPLSVARVGHMNIPVGGGGYFRLTPLKLTMRWLGQLNRKSQQPFVFYIHPWEVDPDQPRLSGRVSSRLRHYLNLKQNTAKLRTLLSKFEFSSLGAVIKDQGLSVPPAIEQMPCASHQQPVCGTRS